MCVGIYKYIHKPGERYEFMLTRLTKFFILYMHGVEDKSRAQKGLYKN